MWRALIAIVMSVLGGAAAAQSGQMEVTALYRERIAPPPDAQLIVTMKAADDAVLSLQRYALTGVPMTVALSFDPALISDQDVVSVQAEIEAGGAQIFESAAPVFLQPSQFDGGVTLVLISSAPPQIFDKTWEMVAIENEPVAANKPPRLQEQSSGAFSMFAGCNQLAGQATVKGSALAFPLSSAGTMKACPPAEERLERAVLTLLPRVTTFVVEDGDLVLRDATGSALMQFRETVESD